MAETAKELLRQAAQWRAVARTRGNSGNPIGERAATAIAESIEARAKAYCLTHGLEITQ